MRQPHRCPVAIDKARHLIQKKTGTYQRYLPLRLLRQKLGIIHSHRVYPRKRVCRCLLYFSGFAVINDAILMTRFFFLIASSANCAAPPQECVMYVTTTSDSLIIHLLRQEMA